MTRQTRPITIRVVAGGETQTFPIYEEDHWFTAGDSLTINLPNIPVVFSRGEMIPIRVMFRGVWYDMVRREDS